ncbi:hypothetical protein OBBRIDRAFT_495873 [Obba rivulosa]|uniref:Jacalin-type lectin domain-containing protein n=1 Tax=Obba rivulosa TaxID=1052685 RepID=A0A8E2AKS4_9APHY|nr:hypothetical protein OBBRIDRAFT_495873 [Obba rivulosa]
MPDWPPYPDGPFTGEFVVGGFGGWPFQTCKWVTNQSALIVKALDVWYNTSTLRGIQVTFSDNSRSPVFGNPSDSHGSVTFSPGEVITSLTLWGNGVGSRTGRIRLTTNGGQTFDVGKNTSGQSGYDAGIGSGILVGMVGRSGADIDMLGPVFLNGAIASISISNVTYNPPLVGTTGGISQVTLDEAYYYNPPNATRDLPWDFTNSDTRTTSTSFTQSTSTTYGASVTVGVTAELFGIGASAEGSFQWQSTGTQETTTSTSSEKSLTWSVSGDLAPGQGLTAISLCQQGVGQANYTSTVTMKLSDGTVSTYNEPGVFNNVIFTQVQVTVQPNTQLGKPRKTIEAHRRWDVKE